MSLTSKFTLMLLVTIIGCIQFSLPMACADGPADNRPDQVRPIPPVGIEIPRGTIDALAWRCKAIRAQWQTLLGRDQPQSTGRPRKAVATPPLAALTSEVLVFPRAVELAIEFKQFYKTNDLEIASQLLDEANRRLDVAAEGGEWADVVGLGDGSRSQLIIGGYSSKIDGSYQPYGLVLPRGLGRGDARPRRLDLWFHGRGEKLSEVAFLAKQRSDGGQYAPEDTIVLHPFGRYCNAFKFAGEIDVLEARDYVRSRLPVDPDRISVRGFSMGGAACWQFATHYADQWFAANPGAGFSETPEFLEFFQEENVRESAPDYQQTLWQLYDCPPWAINLAHCPTVAYSGEIDRQKQAADVMEAALEKTGIDMVHVIGPETAHKIHPESKIEIAERMAGLARRARSDTPLRVDFATVTLRYHKMHWVDVQGLAKHWVPARVAATIDGSTIHVTTENVTRLRLAFEAGEWPGSPSGPITVQIDGEKRVGPLVGSDRSWTWELSRHDIGWQPAKQSVAIRKRPGLQGPIDDAFMDSFVFILPSGESSDESFQRWAEAEAQHAMLHWRKHFRGDVRKKLDLELTSSDIEACNLILFGDPESNKVIRLIEKDLPIRWQETSIAVGSASVSRSGHAAVMIFPNPLNPDRYIVLNSGFTFREYDYLNNARQTPKLPDWALVDIREGATSQLPGIIKATGFFNESWQP
jgi:pimeloyl-ACP methyl ester carboxylesterase